MSEKLTVSQFANRYMTAKTNADKANVIKSVITRPYVPFLEKVTTLKLLLGTAITEKDGLKIRDEIALHVNFHLVILTLYTNLIIEKNGEDDKEAMFRAYDIMESCGLWEKIVVVIGRDYVELEKVRDLYLANIDSENDLTRQLASQVTRFSTLISTSLKPAMEGLKAEIDNLSSVDKEHLKESFFEVVK